MTRCDSCNSIVTRTDSECFVCSEPVNGAARRKKVSKAKVARPVTPVTNLLFMASLVLTGVSFLSSQKMPVPIAASLSGILLATKLVTDRKAAPASSARASRSSGAMPSDLMKRITL